jgi:2-polyprenyl-6-methoxyphenol hydroxylase-like FAD-dependent oxidoreductase
MKTFTIVGGGIGGLCTAIALHRRGFAVQVYENAPAIRPLGAGIVLAANAIKALAEIGISDVITPRGKLLHQFRILTQTAKPSAGASGIRIILPFTGPTSTSCWYSNYRRI